MSMRKPMSVSVKTNATTENLKEVLSNIWRVVPVMPASENHATIRVSHFADLEVFSVDIVHKDGWRRLCRVAIFKRQLSLKERQQRRHEIAALAAIKGRQSCCVTDDFGFAMFYGRVRVPTRFVEILLNRRINNCGTTISCEEVWRKYTSWEEGKAVIRAMVSLKGELNSAPTAFFYIGQAPAYEVRYCF